MTAKNATLWAGITGAMRDEAVHEMGRRGRPGFVAAAANAQGLAPTGVGPAMRFSDVSGPYVAMPPEAPPPGYGPRLLPPMEVYTIAAVNYRRRGKTRGADPADAGNAEGARAGLAPSLRANGVRLRRPDDSEAIQSNKNWIASSQALLAMTVIE
jgi:hypothetical protein